MQKIGKKNTHEKMNQQFLKIDTIILTIILIISSFGMIFSSFEMSMNRTVQPVKGEYALEEYGILNVTSPLGVESDSSGYIYIASSNYDISRYGPNNEQYNEFTFDHYPELFCYHDHSLFVGLKGTSILYEYDRTGIYSQAIQFKSALLGDNPVQIFGLTSDNDAGFYIIGRVVSGVTTYRIYQAYFSSTGSEVLKYYSSTGADFSTSYSKAGFDGSSIWWYYDYIGIPRIFREDIAGANLFVINPSSRVYGMDFDDEGYCYAALSNSVVVYNTLGEVVSTTILDFTPSDLEISNLGLIYLVDTPNNQVHVYTLWYEPGGGGFPGGTTPAFELLTLLSLLLIIKYRRQHK